MKTIDLVIPALDEALAIHNVLERVPKSLIRRTVVVDNGSTDQTAEVALACGAEVVCETRRGYGSAMAAGVRHLAIDPPDIVLFMDADGSDDPRDIPRIVAPLLEDRCDLVIGVRTPVLRESRAMKPVQMLGTRLSCWLLRLLYGRTVSDLGPFRAIRWTPLGRLDMRDRAFGWTAEMQAKAVRAGLRIEEVPVACHQRTGCSKISGTLVGTLAAGRGILAAIFRYRHWMPKTGSNEF